MPHQTTVPSRKHLQIIAILLLATLITAFWLASASSAREQPLSTSPNPPDQNPYTHRATTIYSDSLYLDGGDDYVSVDHAPELNLSGLDGYTLEAWVRPTAITTDCLTILSKAELVDLNVTSAYYLGLCDNKIRFASGNTAAMTGTTQILADTWTHVAVVWQSTGVYTYYINGAVEGSGTLANSEPGNPTTPLQIGTNAPFLLEDFEGNLAEVRLWSVARNQNAIRRSMHIALQEARPGLVAAWPLLTDFDDSIGEHHGTNNNGDFTGPEAPPQPAIVPVDATFASLGSSLYEASTAYLPNADAALLIGGERGGSASDSVDLVDLSNGSFSAIATLPAPRRQAGAAFRPEQSSAYVFGGRDGSGSRVDTIYKVTLGIPTNVTELGATLPQDLAQAAAVYHPGLDKIYILGGEGDAGSDDGILTFDPASDTITGPLSTRLPIFVEDAAVAYASATGHIYLFGGDQDFNPTDAIVKVTLQANGQISTVTELSPTLPAPAEGMRAVEDPATQLVYLLGGSDINRVLVFDPVTEELWSTYVYLEEERVAPAVFYSVLNRHAVVMGGSDGSSAQQSIWRIPLGNGPAVPIGLWDFPQPVGADVESIDGDETKVAVATYSDGLWVYDSDGLRTQYDSTDFGTDTVYDTRYDAANDRTWAATANGGYLVGTSGAYSTGTTYAVDVKPGEASAGLAYFFGGGGGLAWKSTSGDETSFGGEIVSAIDHREFGDLWALANNNLKHLTYNAAGPGTETSYGQPCYDPGGAPLIDSPEDLLVDPSGNWWIPIKNNTGGPEFFRKGGVCYIAADDTPGGNNLFEPGLGNSTFSVYATTADVDADDRVWVSLRSVDTSYPSSGGLVAYQVIASDSPDAADTIRTQEYNWLDGPLGDNTVIGGHYWDSGVTAVGAADERVWAGKDDGRLVTLSQRWQQFNESNNMDQKAIVHVWNVRGRAFFATDSDLHVLQPDGKTWETRSGVAVNAMLGDSQGRIWAATDNGVRLYTGTGWQTLDDKQGSPPTGIVEALAEDQDGRIWIGGENGLTLFDRDRFVFTLDAGNSELPANEVNTLLVDRDNRLWVGTTAGLARLDDSQWSVWNDSNGLFNENVKDLAQLTDGRIAVSTFNKESPGDLFRVSKLEFFDGSTFVNQEPPISDITRLLHLPLSIDEQGRLWAGSAVYSANGWRGYYTTNSGLRSYLITDVTADGAERVWFSHGSDNGVSLRGTTLPPLADVQPVITGLSPDTGSAGDIIAIEGSGFGNNADRTHVTIGGIHTEIMTVTENTIHVKLNDQNRSGAVSVSIDGNRVTFSGSGDATAFCAEPVISSFAPTGGTDGTLVHIRGTNFDPQASIFLGSGNAKENNWRDATPTHLRVIIEETDTDGALRVVNENDCAKASAATEFRRYTPTIAHIDLNQGVPSLPKIVGKPTMVRSYVQLDRSLRPSDTLSIDAVTVEFSNQDQSRTYHTPYTQTIAHHVGSLSDTALRLIDDSVNVVVTPDIDDLIDVGGRPDVNVTLSMNGFTVAEGMADSSESLFVMNQPLRVLLVPIMNNNFDATQVFTMQQNINTGLDNLHQRIWPTGRVETYWSSMDFTVDQVLDLTPGESTEINIGNFIQLYNASHELDKARHRWNKNHDPDVLTAFGIVDGRVVVGDTAGKAFWPGASQIINTLALHEVDFLCDVGNAVVKVLTLGALGSDDGCHLEIPLYVGWAQGDSNTPSQLIGHELGHTMGLVGLTAYNSGVRIGPDENVTHSINDELDGGERGDMDEGGTSFDPDKTYYRQPGVREPVVNTLTGQQFPPAMGATANCNTVTSGACVDRAKALMSYGAEIDNDNPFFEPVDVLHIYREFAISSARNFVHGLQDILPINVQSRPPLTQSRREQAAETPTPIPITGDRLYVNGLVNREGMTGTIDTVDMLGENAPLSPGFNTGFALVQLDDSGEELDSIGLFPISETVHDDQVEHDVAFFATTVLITDSVARLELRYEGTVLDSFKAGSAVPSVNINSPSGGTYNSGAVPVSWSASDADGDSLEMIVDYSADDGATWTTMAFSQETSGTVNLPVARLGGSENARVRVFASDGFHTGVATSTKFTVADQPPRPYINFPASGDTFLEGQRLILRGGADDNQDISLSGDSLRWISDRDGSLGSGKELGTSLSVGTHTLTLEAENSAGLTASTSLTLTIQGDYDYDGIPDDKELDDGLSPLDERDAFSDSDGDDLSLRVERRRGTDPTNPDSDGDGRDDGQEVADGTDPNTSDDPITNTLEVSPEGLSINADLSQPSPMPQSSVQIVSRRTITWNLSADVDWLAASAVAGQTLAEPIILVDAYRLTDGQHHGNLFIHSPNLNVTRTVPVTVSVTDSAAHFDANDDGGLNIGDVQRVAGQIPSNNGEAGFDFRQDIDRDGDVDTDDADWIAGRWPVDHVCCPITYTTSSASVSLNITGELTDGATITATARISDAANLGGFEMGLNFADGLAFQSATLSGKLGSSGRTVAALSPITETEGNVVFGGYTHGSAGGASGNGILARFIFQVLDSGNTDMTAENVLLADTTGNVTRPTLEGPKPEPKNHVYIPIVLKAIGGDR